jgi:hypothetical protein
LFMGIVLCRLQECEVECINLTIAFGGEQNLPTPMPLVFSFLFLHFVGHVCVDLTITFRRRWTRPTHSFAFGFFDFMLAFSVAPPFCNLNFMRYFVHIAIMQGRVNQLSSSLLEVNKTCPPPFWSCSLHVYVVALCWPSL